MRPTAPFLWSCLLIFGISGCGGDGYDPAAGPDATPGAQPTPQIGITVGPDPGYAGYPVALNVTVSSLYSAVRSVSVDFTNDGVVDEVRTFDQGRVTATFQHTYAAAGVHTARAEATLQNGESIVATRPISIDPIAEVPVRAQVVAGSRLQDAACYAVGPPTTCEGCETHITYTIRRVDLGTMTSGAPVSVTQRFRSRTVAGCSFSLAIVAGPPGAEAVVGESGCVTKPTSLDSGPLECSATAVARVP